MSRTLVRLFAFVAIVLGTTAFGANVVYAHNTQETSSPASGEVLAVAPTEWIVGFTKTVPLDTASAEIVGGDGVRVALAPPRHGATDNIIVFDLPPNLVGSVTARWRLVGVDGHVISGRIPFSVEAVAAVVPEAVVTPDSVVAPEAVVAPVAVVVEESDSTVAEPIRFSLRLVNYVSLMALAGVLMAEWLLAQGTLALSLARRFALVGALGVAIAPLLQLLIFIDDIQTSGNSWLSGFGDALGTTAGGMLFAKTALGVLLVALVRRTADIGALNSLRSRLIAATGVMYLVALAYVGHSRSQAAPWLGVPVDVLHTAAAATWLGGLAALVFVVIPKVDTEHGVAAFDRFGNVAERAVAVLVITGIIQMLRLHGNPLSMLTNRHGLMLILKISLVALMLWLAARNRRELGAQRRRESTQPKTLRRLLVRASLIETAIGGVVLVITSVLVATTPT
jgi:copper transport protein